MGDKKHPSQNKLPQLKNIGVVIQLKIIVQNLKMIFVKIYMIN